MRLISIIFLASCLLANLLHAQSDKQAASPIREYSGKIVSIADGDTVTLLVDKAQIKIRLNGIDAPETGQAFSRKAKNYLSELVTGKTVTAKEFSLDRYGRSICDLIVDDEKVNHKLVEMGFAWHFVKYSDCKLLAELQQKAKANNVGLWSEKNPIPPWEWRKLSNDQKKTSMEKSGGLTFWLNTNGNVRHNQSCRFFENTKQGRECGADEGKACGICGG